MEIVARNVRGDGHLDFMSQVKNLSGKFSHDILFQQKLMLIDL